MNKLIGNAVVGQSGGPTAAINATLSGVIRGAKAAHEDGIIETLYGMQNGIEGFLEERIIPLNDLFGKEEDLALLECTPSSALGSCRRKLPTLAEDEAIYNKLLVLFKKYNIRYFFYIGGNDSMDTVAKLSVFLSESGYEMRVIGIPKTIDNDLAGTDHTPGYGSAAKYIATTTQEILRDCAVYTTKAVTIIEVMGRDSGWLTAASALPRIVYGVAPDYVYLPEITFDLDRFYEDVKRAFEKHPNVVIAVSEGIHFEDGTYVGEGAQTGVIDAFGHRYLSGTGNALKMALKENLGCKVRCVELNTSQRCAAHLASRTDITEAVQVGFTAVSRATRGISGHMIVMRRTEGVYNVKMESTEVSLVANIIKKVPPEFINDEGNNVTDQCLEYLLPLIKGEMNPPFVCGLPKHFTFGGSFGTKN